MEKIPTLFERDPDDRRYVTATATPGCEWVLAAEGRPTRKWDGTCVRRDEHGAWWARREVKPGKQAPAGFVAVTTDGSTGKTMGWEPADASPFARFLAEALAAADTAGTDLPAGTYELIGPKVNGNPDGAAGHVLVPHGWASDDVERDLAGAPRDHAGLAGWLRARPYEGIVWHHPDGRRAKLKARDFPA